MTRLTVAAAILIFGTTPVLAFGDTDNIANTNPVSVTGGTYVVEPNHTRVQFSVMHMGFTNWNGDFTGVSGSLQLDPQNVAASKLDISIPVATVSTTNAKLDGELKSADWLDANRFPTMRLLATKIVRTAALRATLTGNLTLHGVTKPIVLDVSFNGAGVNPMDKHYTVGFEATAKVRRSDFGVTKYIPVVGDETTLHISAAFERVN